MCTHTHTHTLTNEVIGQKSSREPHNRAGKLHTSLRKENGKPSASAPWTSTWRGGGGDINEEEREEEGRAAACLALALSVGSD